MTTGGHSQVPRISVLGTGGGHAEEAGWTVAQATTRVFGNFLFSFTGKFKLAAVSLDVFAVSAFTVAVAVV